MLYKGICRINTTPSHTPDLQVFSFSLLTVVIASLIFFLFLFVQLKGIRTIIIFLIGKQLLVVSSADIQKYKRFFPC